MQVRCLEGRRSFPQHATTNPRQWEIYLKCDKRETPAGISGTCAATGFYNHGSDQSGFVRERGGKIVTFDVQNAWATEPTALNGVGTVAGSNYVSGGHGVPTQNPRGMHGPIYPQFPRA